MASVSIAKDAPKEVKADVALEKVPNFALYGLIKDSKSGQLLADVAIKIVDKKSGKVIFDGKTPGTGDFSQALEGIKLNDELTYSITLSKEGYLTKVADFKHKVDKPGLINVHEKLDVSIGKVEIGTDLASLIDIKPIYFDLGKYAIRKDAAVELEKIVKVMNEYPTMVIELGSHTDCRSSKDFNMTLSTNRAKASADYIKKKIKNPERIYGKGFGESKLKVNCPCEGAVKSNCSEEEHQKNRRTEFIIMKM
jgi:outer membrane protein OmpA-like peptidoglycan-associated protein